MLFCKNTELKEMIKVMQHYENGGEIECSDDGFKTVLCTADKERDGDLSWSWDEFDYRIKEEKQKVTIEKWLIKDVNSSEYLIMESSDIETYKHYEKIKLIKSYEVEL